MPSVGRRRGEEVVDGRGPAERWGITTTAVYRLAREGHVPCVRLPERTVRFVSEAVEAFERNGGSRDAVNGATSLPSF